MYESVRIWNTLDNSQKQWVEDLIETSSSLRRSNISSLCLRQVESLPRKISVNLEQGTRYEHPYLINSNNLVIAKSEETGGWVVSRLWTPAIENQIKYLEGNPLYILDRVTHCPFCGQCLFKVALDDECSMLFATWGNYIVKVMHNRCTWLRPSLELEKKNKYI